MTATAALRCPVGVAEGGRLHGGASPSSGRRRRRRGRGRATGRRGAAASWARAAARRRPALVVIVDVRRSMTTISAASARGLGTVRARAGHAEGQRASSAVAKLPTTVARASGVERQLPKRLTKHQTRRVADAAQQRRPPVRAACDHPPASSAGGGGESRRRRQEPSLERFNGPVLGGLEPERRLTPLLDSGRSSRLVRYDIVGPRGVTRLSQLGRGASQPCVGGMPPQRTTYRSTR